MSAEGRLCDAEQVLAGTPAAVGGKAWQLARLRRFGLPVPEFRVLPAGTDLGRESLDAVIADLAALGWLDRPLAVRSSAVGEDGAHASFAGIYRSCLNVLGTAQLRQAIAEVRASVDTPAARAYRERLGTSGGTEMAVIVMPMVAARISGIAFTCDPATGRDDRLVIHANPGLGESLVGGRTVGDEHVCAEDTAGRWRLIDSRRGGKGVMTVARPEGGTRTVPLSAEAAAEAALSPNCIEALAGLLQDAALALDFAAPFHDLEWAWDGRAFWLLQGRPVTSRPYRTYPALRDQAAIWTRGNTCEVVPEPLSPIDWSLSRWGVNSLLEQGWRLMDYPLLPGVQRAGLFEGRLYLEASIMQWEAWDAIGIPPVGLNALMGGHQPVIGIRAPSWRERAARLGRMLRFMLRAPARRRQGEAEIARIMDQARRTQNAPPPAGPEALRRALSRQAEIARGATGLHFLQGSGGGSLSLLVNMLEKNFPGEGVALSAALQAGGKPSVTARQGYALLHLARLASRPEARGQPLADPAFSEAFQAFLDAYGHRGSYETYFRSPRWREKPEAVLALVRGLEGVDEADLRRRQQQAVRSAQARLRSSLPLRTRLWIRILSRTANKECNQREAARSALIAHLAVTRSLLLASANWLTSAGALRQPEEIHLLVPSEVERALAGLIPASGLLARVAERASLFRQWHEKEAPEYLLLEPDGKSRAGNADPLRAEPGEAHLSWRGVATGTGVGRGRVRILRHPDQGARLQPGEILVAPSTDPGWTPLFLKAGGLVVETGGYLSHGAIVAREFALPAVVNLPGILSLLHDGDEVEVDGLQGVVRVRQTVSRAASDADLTGMDN